MERAKSERVKESAQRTVRIAKGLTHPDSRPRYVEAAKQRFRGEERDPSVERCLVCDGTKLNHRTVHRAKQSSNASRQVRICRDCGHVSIPDNRKEYDQRGYDELPSSARTGATGKPGRDFHIATLALEALGRDDVDVLLYGVGASRDNHHIAGLAQVGNVAIGDIMKLRDDGEFVDLTQAPPRKFPLLIASEVIEHFRDPRPDFQHMFDFLSKDGLAVCATNVYDGGNLSKDPYIFYSDHTSYYTPQALAIIADVNGYHLDFRMPVIGAGLRKRYVMFTKSRKVLDRLAVYFGSHAYAPSETSFSLRRHDHAVHKRA